MPSRPASPASHGSTVAAPCACSGGAAAPDAAHAAVRVDRRPEAGWNGDRSRHFGESEVAVEQALGASYEIGAELLDELPLESSWERQNFFVGADLAFRGEGWARTPTAIFFADGEAGEPEFRLRVLVECEF